VNSEVSESAHRVFRQAFRLDTVPTHLLLLSIYQNKSNCSEMAWQPRPDRPEEISADPQRSPLRAYEIAGVPERHEPDTGEIRYSYLFDLLNEIGYSGRVGCEYRPAGITMDGLGRFRTRAAGI